MCWTWCSNVVQTKMKEIRYTSFSPHCVGENISIWNWNKIFSSVGQVLDRFFLYCTLTEAFAIGFQICFEHDWIDFGFFCWNNPRFVVIVSLWTNFSITCSLCFFFGDIKSFL